MALITSADIATELGETFTAGTTEATLVTALISGVESVWSQLTNRVWESATVTEFHNGGGKSIMLTRLPVTALTRIGYGKQEVAEVYNTSTYSTAHVQVTSTGVTCTLDGTGSTLTFASYATVDLLVAAINALGSNWYAETVSGYGSWKTSELLPMFPQNCLDSNGVYLSVPYQYLYGYELDETTGRVRYAAGFPDGYRNIVANYTGGLSSTPDWLKRLLVRQVCHWFKQAKEARWDMSSKSEPGGAGTVAFSKLESNLLPEFKLFADMNRLSNGYYYD